MSDDLLPITLNNVSFSFFHGKEVLRNVTIEIPQGTMVALAGPHNSGKSCVTDLLCDILMPQRGNVFVPAHLRVLHVSREPIFWRAPLLHNLAFGLPPHESIDAERIIKILKLLDLTELIPILRKDIARHMGELADWRELSDSSMENGTSSPRKRLSRAHRASSRRGRSLESLFAMPETIISHEPSIKSQRSYRDDIDDGGMTERSEGMSPSSPIGSARDFSSPGSSLSMSQIAAEDLYHSDWIHTLTLSMKMRVHLARAFIANPPVIVLSRNLSVFNHDNSMRMLDVIRQHVDGRGLCMKEGETQHKRPRTVIYTVEDHHKAAKADIVLEGDPKTKSFTKFTPEVYLKLRKEEHNAAKRAEEQAVEEQAAEEGSSPASGLPKRRKPEFDTL
jgi:ABC-type nitrate/sulfonate/bicarbonate transport system ATPase subunit